LGPRTGYGLARDLTIDADLEGNKRFVPLDLTYACLADSDNLQVASLKMRDSDLQCIPLRWFSARKALKRLQLSRAAETRTLSPKRGRF